MSMNWETFLWKDVFPGKIRKWHSSTHNPPSGSYYSPHLAAELESHPRLLFVGSRPIALAVLGSKPPNEVGLLAQKGDLLDSMRNLNSYMGMALFYAQPALGACRELGRTDEG